MPSLSQKVCCFKGCNSSRRKYPNMHIFRFPVRDAARCKQWIENTGCPEGFNNLTDRQIASKTVCALHFELTSFMNYLCNSLTRFAVPVRGFVNKDMLSLLEPQSSDALKGLYIHCKPLWEELHGIKNDPNTGDELCESDRTIGQDDFQLSTENLVNNENGEQAGENSLEYEKENSHHISVKNNEVSVKRNEISVENAHYISVLKNNEISVKHNEISVKQNKAKDISTKGLVQEELSKDLLLESLGKYLKGPPLILFRMQILRKDNDSASDKWSTEEKELALTMYYKSPSLYTHMRDRQHYVLPSDADIQHWINCTKLFVP